MDPNSQPPDTNPLSNVPAPEPPTAPQIPTEQPPEASAPPPKSGKKKLIFIILGIIILVTLLAIGSFFYSTKQKAQIKELASQQVVKFAELESTYGQILSLVKDTEGSDAQETKLLSVAQTAPKSTLIQEDGDVLGLEDQQVIEQIRQVGEHYRKGTDVARDISEINSNIKSKAQKPPVNFLVKSDKNLLEKTEKFTGDTTTLLDYLSEENNLSLKAVTLFYDVFISLEQAIQNNADTTTVSKLEEKVDNIEELKREYEAIDTSNLSDELKDIHKKGLDDFEKVEGPLRSIIESLKERDEQKLVSVLESFFTDIAAAAEISTVDTISFWQNNTTIRSTQDLKSDWQKYEDGL